IEVVLGLKEEEVAGRPIIIIEDVVDTGNTLSWFKEDLKKMNPQSVKIASLLLKPDALQHPIKVDYLGFSIPTEFVIGYGLDYNEGGRDLAGIYQKI
ncbi:MAG: phosphoribosyltransferase family protein, partial [Bacteroidota bacterium]